MWLEGMGSGVNLGRLSHFHPALYVVVKQNGSTIGQCGNLVPTIPSFPQIGRNMDTTENKLIKIDVQYFHDIHLGASLSILNSLEDFS